MTLTDIERRWLDYAWGTGHFLLRGPHDGGSSATAQGPVRGDSRLGVARRPRTRPEVLRRTKPRRESSPRRSGVSAGHPTTESTAVHLPGWKLERRGRQLSDFLGGFGHSIDPSSNLAYAHSIDLVPRFPGRKPNGGGDIKPSKREIEFCEPWLRREIEIVSPKAVVLLGALPTRSFLQPCAGVRIAKLEDVAGQAIPASVGSLEVTMFRSTTRLAHGNFPRKLRKPSLRRRRGSVAFSCRPWNRRAVERRRPACTSFKPPRAPPGTPRVRPSTCAARPGGRSQPRRDPRDSRAQSIERVPHEQQDSLEHSRRTGERRQEASDLEPPGHFAAVHRLRRARGVAALDGCRPACLHDHPRAGRTPRRPTRQRARRPQPER